MYIHIYIYIYIYVYTHKRPQPLRLKNLPPRAPAALAVRKARRE